jgi:acetyl-CoA acyltransferase
MRDAVIVDIIRTASGKGKNGGALNDVHPVDLLGSTLRGLLVRNDLDPALVDDVIAGCVSQVGQQSSNVARSAVLAAGLPESVPGTTVDRQCGSSQQAAHFAAQGVLAGAYDVAIACGVESMSRVPMFSNVADQDAYGGQVRHRYEDGLIGQGISAELVAARWKLTRDDLDEYAARSHARAAETAGRRAFVGEILPVEVDGRVHDRDETVRVGTTSSALAGLKPVFCDDEYSERFPEIAWSVTAGNSSPLSDGASAALIMEAKVAERLGLRPRARFHSFAVAGADPILMLMAIVPATQQALRRAGLGIGDIDAFEVNEAFASVPLAWRKEFDVDIERLNPRGGAIALGHPLGASGTRLMCTLLSELESTGGRYGLQTMCEAGGVANATIIERL